MSSYKEFEMVDGSQGRLPVQQVIGDILPVGVLNRPAPRVRLPFKSVRDLYGYPSLYFRKTERRLHKEPDEFFSKVSEFLRATTTILSGFQSSFSSYDKEVVLPSTSALSYVPTTHFDLDEKGEFGHERKFLFPVDLLNYIVGKRSRAISNEEPPMSLKRGTNLGWPTQKSNSGRLERDVLLAGHVALSIGGKAKGLRLRDISQFLSTIHGAAFAVAGERLQHTDRVLPYFLAGTSGFGWHIQPRVRGIYFSPKYCVAWNRSYVKRFLKAMMLDPIHTQDRGQLQRWFERARRSDRLTFSIDVSRFDQSVGGAQGRQILSCIAASLAHDESIDRPSEMACAIFDDLDHEFSMPCLIRTSQDLYLSEGAEILSSGLSSTSLIGSTYSEALVYLLASRIFGSLEKAVAQEGALWSALTWGDDIVFSFDRSALPFTWSTSGDRVESIDSLLAAFSKEVDLTFTQEPTLKFLGQNYDMLEFSDATCGYPVGRFVQQQFFPERKKVGPAQTIGVVARTAMLDSSLQKHVFEKTMEYHSLAHIDRPIQWRDRLSACEEAVREMAQSSTLIAGADDVLNIFTHGLEPDDLPEAALPEGTEAFASLLAQASVDVTDPAEFLKRVGFKSDRVVSLIRSLTSGDLLAWLRFLQEVQKTFGGSLNRNDSFY